MNTITERERLLIQRDWVEKCGRTARKLAWIDRAEGFAAGVVAAYVVAAILLIL